MDLQTEPGEVSVLATYETFAPFYDAFTADYEYESWMADVEAWAVEEGLRGRRLLDVACGTGKSFMPMLERGYEVTACDLSPAMVARARARAAGGAEVRVADMRALPWRGRFDLATCVDDSFNYLLSAADLVAALHSIGEALCPGGLLVFDTNSLAAYRSSFASELFVESDRTRFRWRGEGSEFMPPGGLASATIEVLPRTGEAIAVGRHVQRHHPISTVEMACSEAGLRVVGVRGECPERGMVSDPDEETHARVVFMAAKPAGAPLHL